MEMDRPSRLEHIAAIANAAATVIAARQQSFDSEPVYYESAPVYQQPVYVERDDEEEDYEPAEAYEAPEARETGDIDLVLEDAVMVQEATKLAGPAYAIRFRNQGLADSPRFTVAAVTSKDGSYKETAPKAEIKVPGLKAGESKDVVVRLPRAKFSHLILMVDSKDDVEESNKENNASVIERGEL